jgi:FkbM family methyltransferase
MEMTEDPGQQLYPGLYGEVVTEDCYGIKAYAESHDPPDVIFDIGANVGIFTRFAREVFPEAFIVAVEPDETNMMRLEVWTPAVRRIALFQAIGQGPVWKAEKAVNGAHETYLTVNPGYTEAFMDSAPGLRRTPVESVMLSYLVGNYVNSGERYLIKIDCEGNENAIFADPESMQALAGADYFAMEIHTTAAHGGEPLAAVRKLIADTWERLSETHDMVKEHAIWRGTRKR